VTLKKNTLLKYSYLSSNYIINRFLNEETPSTERVAELIAAIHAHKILVNQMNPPFFRRAN
jgi:hypothetical protein